MAAISTIAARAAPTKNAALGHTYSDIFMPPAIDAALPASLADERLGFQETPPRAFADFIYFICRPLPPAEAFDYGR